LGKQLERIRQAYDLTVKQYRLGTDPHQDIPEDIKNSVFYKSLLADGKNLGSSAPDIKDYLKPAPGMKFLDAGCSANLVNYRLDQWPSTYYGVDISPELINAMKGFVASQRISVGGLFVADISKLPFDDYFFDIAAVIGVLEYFDIGYINRALKELHRVLKPGSRVVLDIPNKNHPYVNDMAALEKYLGRSEFIHECSKYEKLLTPLFSIESIDDSHVMLKYFMKTLKFNN
jgi:ubiquinone/menaquinone biosynthesis C-methylase UbiE